MSGQTPPKRRYITRVFGLYAGGTYRSSYVIRVPIYADGPPLPVQANVSVGSGTVTVEGYAPTLQSRIPVGVGTVTITGGAAFTQQDKYISPGAGDVTVTGYQVEKRISIYLDADTIVFVQGGQPVTLIAKQPAAGSGTITVTGYAPTTKLENRILAGVGTVTITGYAPEKYATQTSELVLVAQYRIKRISIGSGIHRRSHYQVVRSLIPLTSESSETAGVGTISIQGYPPDVSAVIGALALPGAGTITIQGYSPQEVVKQDLLNTGIWRTFLRRTTVGTGVHRQHRYHWERKYIYFATYDDGRTIPVGVGEVTIQGYQPATDPLFRVTQAGSITIQGYPPSPILDGKVATLDDELVEVIRNMHKRRRLSARYAKAYPEFKPYNATVIDYVRERPQRIIGVPNGTVRVIGYRPTLTKDIPVGVGTISIQGQALTSKSDISVGVGTVTIQGYEASLGGITAIQQTVGVGTVTIQSYQISIFADGVAYAGTGVGTITINGKQVSSTQQIAPSAGSGTITVTGYAAQVSVVAQAGPSVVTITGYTPTPVVGLRIIEPGIGNIYVRNQRIGISTPEKASNPGTGQVVVFGNQPNVISTGFWEKTAGDSISWSHEAQSTGTWTKNSRSSKTWTKL